MRIAGLGAVEVAEPKTPTKRCHLAPARCPSRWKCRGCGANCCEHMCSLKKPDGTAICSKCKSQS